MFTEINNITYNMYSISSFFPSEDDGKYLILYTVANGSVIREEFDSEADRDAKLSELNEKYVIQDEENNG